MIDRGERAKAVENGMVDHASRSGDGELLDVRVQRAAAKSRDEHFRERLALVGAAANSDDAKLKAHICCGIPERDI